MGLLDDDYGIKGKLRALRDTAQSASNAIASNVSGPVDLLAAALRGVGMPIPEDAMGGSKWMADRGLTREVPMGAPRIIGETLGMAGPAVAAAKAPQIAAGLNQMQANAMAPTMLNKQAGKVFVYPQDEALAAAQRNAAKPFSEGGLSLRPDNTAAERARAMGYPTAQGKEMYHSARGDWENSIVDPSKSDIGFHIGTLEQAENRAKAFGSGGVNFDEGANVMPVVTDKYANFLKLNDTGTFHADGIARQLEKKGLLAKGKGKQIEQEIDANFRLRQQYDPLMRDALARNEFDGIKYANQQEGSGLSYAITNPSVVRSRFAAFDPARRNEADLLGRADPALLGILGGGSLLGLGAYKYGKE